MYKSHSCIGASKHLLHDGKLGLSCITAACLWKKEGVRVATVDAIIHHMPVLWGSSNKAMHVAVSSHYSQSQPRGLKPEDEVRALLAVTIQSDPTCLLATPHAGSIELVMSRSMPLSVMLLAMSATGAANLKKACNAKHQHDHLTLSTRFPKTLSACFNNPEQEILNGQKEGGPGGGGCRCLQLQRNKPKLFTFALIIKQSSLQREDLGVSRQPRTHFASRIAPGKYASRHAQHHLDYTLKQASADCRADQSTPIHLQDRGTHTLG